MNDDTDARLWHPWLRIQRLLHDMLGTRWGEEAWAQIKPDITSALAGVSTLGVNRVSRMARCRPLSYHRSVS